MTFDEVYFDRDEEGKLIPQRFEIEVSGVKEEVFLIPLIRGELKRIFSGTWNDYDDYILLSKVFNPSYSEANLEFIKPGYSDVLINKVFEISGVKTDKKEKRKERFENEDEFGKKLRELGERKKEGSMILFLHELGYTFKTINTLTITEINWLVMVFNDREHKKSVSSKGFKPMK